MRIFLGIVVLGATAVVLGNFVGCGDDPEPVHVACREFCPTLVSAMDDDEDNFQIKNDKEAEAKCMTECTDSVEGFEDKLKDKVIDCMECVADEAGDNAEWEDVFEAVMDDCESKCLDDDYPDDPNPWDEFFEDLMEDFNEHWSYGEESGGDADGDGDADCDLDDAMYCNDDYADCVADCADDDCFNACLDSACTCLYDAGCDDIAAESGC